MVVFSSLGCGTGRGWGGGEAGDAEEAGNAEETEEGEEAEEGEGAGFCSSIFFPAVKGVSFSGFLGFPNMEPPIFCYWLSVIWYFLQARVKLQYKRFQVSAQPPAKTTAGLIDGKN